MCNSTKTCASLRVCKVTRHSFTIMCAHLYDASRPASLHEACVHTWMSHDTELIAALIPFSMHNGIDHYHVSFAWSVSITTEHTQCQMVALNRWDVQQTSAVADRRPARLPRLWCSCVCQTSVFVTCVPQHGSMHTCYVQSAVVGSINHIASTDVQCHTQVWKRTTYATYATCISLQTWHTVHRSLSVKTPKEHCL